MFDRKSDTPALPRLLDRVLESGGRRIAVLGLHPRAGARTALAALAAQVQRRSLALGVTSVPRLPFESDLITADPVTRIVLGPGAYLATAEQAAAASLHSLEMLEATGWTSPLGPIGIYRVVAESEVDLYGPDSEAPLDDVLDRLAQRSGGLVLVDGGWERRVFAAPGVTDGLVVVFSAGYSATPERSAAAAGYSLETLTVPECPAWIAQAWQGAAARGSVELLDASGAATGVLPPGLVDPLRLLRRQDGSQVETVLLPHGLNDEFLNPLVRSNFRCRLVIRDATRLSLAPVYFRAWHKGHGSIEVVRPARVLAVATNPFNHAGPDADASDFRRTAEASLPGVPVHDVVAESEDGTRRPIWKFWA
jgi:hypothetical protein